MRTWFAELLGTFVLVLGGVGAAVIAGPTIGPLGISLAFGLALLGMAYAIGPVSGCHVNPAVTFGLWLAGRLPGRQVVPYVAAQIVGAVLACLVLYGVGGHDVIAGGFGANGYGAHSPGGYGLGAAFLSEAALTGVFVFTVLAATAPDAPPGFGGVAAGTVLALVHLVGMRVTNVSVNPARSLAPALFEGGWALSQVWLFLLAPLVGAALAAAAWALVRTRAEAAEEKPVEPVEPIPPIAPAGPLVGA